MVNINRLSLTSLLVLVTSSASAGGFQITPTTSSIARSLGGNGVIGEDLGEIFYNPAALSFFENQTTILASATAFDFGNTFQNRNSVQSLFEQGAIVSSPLTGTNRGSNDSGAIGSLFLSSKAPWSEKLTLGFSITAPWGLSTTYDFDWIGRYQSTSAELEVIDANFSASYALSDKLDIGIGVSIQEASATFVQAAPNFLSADLPDLRVEVEGSDRAYGFNAGMIYQLNDSLRLGVSYRSEMKHNLDGHQSTFLNGDLLQPDLGSVIPLKLPASAMIGFHLKLRGNWSVAGGSRWTNWSEFKDFEIEYDNGALPPVSLPQNWENSLTTAVSVDYAINNKYKLIASLAYDESPVSNAQFRSALVPAADLIGIGLGLEIRSPFANCMNCRIYFAFNRVSVGDRNIQSTVPLLLPPGFSSTLDGVYKKDSSNLFALHYQHSF